MRRKESPLIPVSQLKCKCCGDEMNFHFEAFTCYSACDGPYLSVTVRVKCSSDKCAFVERGKIHSRNAEEFTHYEKSIQELLNKQADIMGNRATSKRWTLTI